MSNHLGSHVDVPRHFVADGKAVDDYDIREWIFRRCCLADVRVATGVVITPADVEPYLKGCPDTDLLLLRTGFESKRGANEYWEDGPGCAPSLAGWLRERLPSIAALGIDSLSLSSRRHRELGRQAHRDFLGAAFRILEDLSLHALPLGNAVRVVIALPLYIEGADGAPCTVAAWLA